MLLVQVRGECTVIPALTRLLSYHNARDTETAAVSLQCWKVISVLSAVTSLLKYHNAKDIGTGCGVVSTG